LSVKDNQYTTSTWKKQIPSSYQHEASVAFISGTVAMLCLFCTNVQFLAQNWADRLWGLDVDGFVFGG
jgi:hypothetical protein